MIYRPAILLAVLAWLAVNDVMASPAVDALMQEYAQQGATHPDPDAGQRFWTRSFTTESESRQCTSCHGQDLRRPGKHATTGKTIDPLAPSVNPQRLTEVKTINKWFTRNCKWTVGRECSAQEKADVLAYLRDL